MREKLLGSGPETIDLRHISPVHRLSRVQVSERALKLGGFSSEVRPVDTRVASRNYFSEQFSRQRRLLSCVVTHVEAERHSRSVSRKIVKR